MGQHSVNMVAKPCESMGFSMVFAFRLLLGHDRAKIGQHLFQMGRHSIKMGQPRAHIGPTWPSRGDTAPNVGQHGRHTWANLAPKRPPTLGGTWGEPGGDPSVAWGSGFFAACLFLFAFLFVFWRFLRACWANIASSRANIAPRWLNLAPKTDQHSHKTTQHSPKMGQHSQHRPTLAESALHWPRIGPESSPFPLRRPAPGCRRQPLNPRTIWTTGQSKLYRSAPENVRPVTASEARQIPITSLEPTISQIAQQIPQNSQGITRAINLQNIEVPPPNYPIEPTGNPVDVDEQPDNEPEHQATQPPSPSGIDAMPASSENPVDPAVETPVPNDDDDDELLCDNLLCIDDEPCMFQQTEDEAWRCEILITEDDVHSWRDETDPADLIFVASAARRQRAEVKLSTLTPEEKEKFKVAKEAEVQNWIKTGTVSRILRNQIPHDQIMRCRWILTWKPIDDEKEKNKVKAKARLVILGYLDPQLEELPRDSPTLGRNAKMLLLQLIASKCWDLRSFDIKAAFLQGKPQPGRTLAIEPVPELAQALQLATNEICKLEKGAYGLIDAPYLWYVAITEELMSLGFEASPFDPCMFVLRNDRQQLSGVLGLHVDDGICAGDEYFLSKIDLLEQKYPFGSKKLHKFTFTGIDMTQLPDYTIQMSQSNYVKAIQSIPISRDRRTQLSQAVTEAERQQLRAIVGSLQYAAVHTRPDLSSRLSQLQSSINSATVETLTIANQTLHEAKKHHDTTIQIQPIAVQDFRFLAFSDASFASKSNPNSHTGTLIMGTHKDISQNVACTVNPLSWGSKKIQRVVTSTLAAETVSLSSVLDHLSWMRLCWAWMLDRNINWKQPTQTLKQLPITYTTATYNSQHLQPCVATTDCKSLFDLVTRTAMPNCSEFRTQLSARAIKDYLAEGVSLRWVHSGAQLADALTKVMDSSFLRETLRLGKYRLNDELEILKNRASNRNRLKWLKNNCAAPDDSFDQACNPGCNDQCFLVENFGFLGVWIPYRCIHLLAPWAWVSAVLSLEVMMSFLKHCRLREPHIGWG